MLLAGDIGGTRTRLALYQNGTGRLELVHSASYASRSFDALEEIVVRFLNASRSDRPAAACFGVAGAVVAGAVRTTNLPWQLSEAELEKTLRIPRVRLMNDLEVAAHGVVAITDAASLMSLQEGHRVETHGARALVAAGTGLGVALMWWDGERYQVAASEGGHVSFAPQNEIEDALLRFLRAELGHVSYERILSGPGLVNVYRFLREFRGAPEPGWLTDRVAGGDPAPVISAAALAHEDPVCDEALSLFVSIYGAAAGSVAITALATGGVYIGGGIAPKILPRMRDGTFVRSFAHRGRFSETMRRMPVDVVLAPDVALLGAASSLVPEAGEAGVPEAPGRARR